MGLMKLSGDLYDYEEDTKIAMGVESMDANQVAPNNLADKQPQQVDTNVQPIQATLKQPASNVPVAPVAAPEQDIYTPTQKSLPPLPPNTRYASYEGSKMSRLKDLLNKVAMTQEDIDSGYSEIPQGDLSEADLFPEIQEEGDVQNYTVPADYSNYMAAKAPLANESYDIGEYSDLPVDTDPGVYQMSPETMGYSPYESSYQTMGYSPYESSYQTMAYSPYESSYQTLGYSPSQVYRTYNDLYGSSPPTEGGEYQDIQTQAAEAQAAEPEVDPAQQAYQQSYDEIYNYLIQMGYSPEEASASAPALLQQVNVSAPQTQQKQASYTEYYPQPRVMTKTASITFNSRANELKASYVEAGYSPYQAQQMSMEVIIPQAEKYASLAGRLGGGIVGAIGGGLGAHSRYDEGDDTSGLITGAVLGGGAGALLGGRIPSYLGKNVTKADVLKDLGQKQQAIYKKQLDAAKKLDLVGKDSKPANYNALVEDVLKGQKNIQKPRVKDINNPTASERKALDAYDKKVRSLKKQLQAGQGESYKANDKLIKSLNSQDAAEARKALRSFQAEAGRSAMSSDSKKLLTGAATVALPGYYVDSALRRTGGDNLVDGSFDAASSGADTLGQTLSSGGKKVLKAIQNNPELSAALATGAIATPYAIDLIQQQRAKSKKNKTTTKKAYLEANLEKESSLGSAARYAVGTGLAQGIGGYAGASQAELDRYGAPTLIAAGATRGALLGGLSRLGGKGLAKGVLGLSVAQPVLEGSASAANYESQALKDFGRILSGTQEGGYLDRIQTYRENAGLREQQERLDSLRQQISEARDLRQRTEIENQMNEAFRKEQDALQKVLNRSRGYEKKKPGNFIDYIKENPGKSAVIGATTAAGLYGLYNLASGGGSPNQERLRQLQQQQFIRGRGRRR